MSTSKICTWLAIAAFSISLGSCSMSDELPRSTRYQELTKIQQSLRPLHTKLRTPQPGEWLAENEESGQTFKQYLNGQPNRLEANRRALYIQPIGVFDRKQEEIIKLSAEFMGLYFSCPVKVLETMADSNIPKQARRVHPSWGVPQILTDYVLNKVLKPALPEDAFAMIAFTSSDLWPGKGWNFVFGQASLRDRVGVWSIYRNGDPNLSEADFQLCLLRTLKTATHETGHMFSIQHCIQYECNMCGSNHREESDAKPVYLCPECMAKVLWSTDADAKQRYEKLADFCRRNSLKKEAEFYQRSLDALAAAESVNTP